MKTHLTFANRHKYKLPEEFQADDVRYAQDFAEHFISEYSKPGDVVFDPFMGYGTTLIAAENTERAGWGVEFDEKRCAYVRTLLKHPERALHGDSTKLTTLALPQLDLSLTSPPYMGKHHTENPFTSYTTEGAGYTQYLADLRSIYTQIKAMMKPGAHAIIEVSNLKHEDDILTTLAWDIARAVGEVLTFKGEIIITWEGGYAYGYDHSYVLVFKRTD